MRSYFNKFTATVRRHLSIKTNAITYVCKKKDTRKNNNNNNALENLQNNI